MIKAVARAFRWREMLENGRYATVVEIAAEEQINESYVSRFFERVSKSALASAIDHSGRGFRLILQRLHARLGFSLRLIKRRSELVGDLRRNGHTYQPQ